VKRYASLALFNTVKLAKTGVRCRGERRKEEGEKGWRGVRIGVGG
jgi:hypothetical protein